MMITKKDLDEVEAGWGKKHDGEVSFIVTEDVAPRLKTALEDLLKAHGVKVSKY